MTERSVPGGVGLLRERTTDLLRAHARAEMSAGERNDLVDRIYWAIHAPQERHDDSLSSDRAKFAVMVRDAERDLAGLTHERRGFSFLSRDADSGRITASCPDGVEVILDAGQARTGASGEVTCMASGLAEPVGARWLYWSPPGAAGRANARVYVHSTAERAFTTWCAIVRALETAGVQFAAKVGGSDAMLDRPDGIVVYCASDQLRQVVTDVIRCSDEVKEAVPGFGLAVRPGIGVALAPDESTGNPLAGSVGYYWSREVVDAWTAGGTAGLEAVLVRLADSWARARDLVKVPEAA